MATHKELVKILEEKGIELDPKKYYKVAELEAMLKPEANAPDDGTKLPPEPSPEPTNQLVEILTSLTQEINSLKADWAAFKATYPHCSPEVYAIGAKQLLPSTVEIKEENGSTFLTQVPVDLLKAAKDILGEKFTFECNACPDRPAFMFTVVVPKEYSNLPEGEDKRSRIIDNALGANGVREWCTLVKQNVIKTLGVKMNF